MHFSKFFTRKQPSKANKIATLYSKYDHFILYMQGIISIFLVFKFQTTASFVLEVSTNTLQFLSLFPVISVMGLFSER